MGMGLAFVCLLTFVHYTAAQMRGPIVPLYATAHGATATGVGVIVAAHMVTAAAGSIPFGRAADAWGRRPLLLGGMAVGVVASALLPWAESVWALALLYGLAGSGIAAFSPSVLSLVGDVAAPGKIGRAFAWYSTAHYGAIGVGPFLGGLFAERWSYHAGFLGSALGIGLALVLGVVMLPATSIASSSPLSAPWATVKRNRIVWSGWIVAASGLFVQGVVFTFLPLLAQERGLGPFAIGSIFLALGLANTAARVPAGWLIDRSKRATPYAFGGIAISCALTVAVPHIPDFGGLLLLALAFGAVSGGGFVAVSVGLTLAAPPAARGIVMGGYSTALYLGLGLGSLVTGPIVTHAGHAMGFATGGALGAMGTLVALLCLRSSEQILSRRSPGEDGGEHPGLHLPRR